MLLELSTWPEVEAYLAEKRGVIVPIGSTEQHGPSGLIGTDALTAEIFGRRVGEATGTLVAPTISYGMAQHHMAFPGTITLQPSTLVLVVRDVVMSLVRHGFERFYFINGHGGNVHPVNTAFSQIQTELAESRTIAGHGGNQPPGDIRCLMRNWWAGDRASKLRKQLYGDREGYHATPSEIAVTWHAFPDEQRDVPLGPMPSARRSYQGAEDYRKLYPDGRMASDPSLANAADGQRLITAAVEDLAEDCRKFLVGE